MSFQAAHDAGTLGQALVSQNKQPTASFAVTLFDVCLSFTSYSIPPKSHVGNFFTFSVYKL